MIERVTKKIFGNSRMELEFFMYLPNGVYTNPEKSSISINCNPVLYLRCKKNKYVTEEWDYMKSSFKINPRNLYTVIKFFNTIMGWFYDDKYSDLFLVDENGKLIFNADYNKLSVSTPRGDYDQFIMQAIPTVVTLGDKLYEGIHLYINRSLYCIPLTYQEVSIIFGILKDFSFTNEINNVLLSYAYIVKNNAFTAGDRYTIGGNGKTPFDI